MADSRRLMGVVLCGGRSTRMGRDKATLTHPSGATFLELASARLAEVCDDVYLSTANKDDRDRSKRIVDPPDSKGPISGILAALRLAKRARFDACVFNPVDTPGLTAADVHSLVDRWDRDHVVCGESRRDGDVQIEPLISVIPAEFETELRTWYKAGDFGVQKLLLRLPLIRVPLSPAACENINSPADFRKLAREE